MSFDYHRLEIRARDGRGSPLSANRLQLSLDGVPLKGVRSFSLKAAAGGTVEAVVVLLVSPDIDLPDCSVTKIPSEG